MALGEKQTVYGLTPSQVGFLPFTPVFSLVCLAQLVFKVFHSF